MIDKANKLLLIIGPPPTPNGDLHIGHIAGPYMSADVMRRWYKLRGREVLYVTGTDDSQTYVVTSAMKLGLSPQKLAEQSTTEIQRSLKKSLIDVDGFAAFDAGYEESVRNFLEPLHASGMFKLVTRNLPFDPKTGEFLVEGHVGGECPNCLAKSRGALCEACGLPLLCEDLRHQFSSADPESELELKAVEILVFPLESVRDKLEAYYTEDRLSSLRPAAAEIIRNVLAGPLPEFPITYPLRWGLDANFPEVPGQVLNAWAEGMAASMYCTSAALDGKFETGMHAWTRDDIDLVYFLGLDNVYFWGVSHLGLLMAHDGRYMLPANYFSNHFYELDDEKISTSRGHVVLVEELLKKYSPAAIRFYLCWTAPENTERSFSAKSLETVIQRHLIQPWNALWHATEGLIPTELSTEAAADISLMTAELDRRLSVKYFSAAAAARIIAKHLNRLEGYLVTGSVSRAEIATQFKELARLADPILKQAPTVEYILHDAWRPSKLTLRTEDRPAHVVGAATTSTLETI